MKDTIEDLQNLSRHATDAHVLGYGTANVVISTSEFHALEEAIKLLKKTEKQAISGYHRPVCAKCLCDLRPETNGIGLLDMAEWGPYELFDADLWKCPSCGMEVIGGFGHNPISTHLYDDFQKMIDYYKEHSILVENKG